MARYWIVVGGPEVFAKTREMGFVRHGFKSTRRLMAGKIQAGDRLGFYVTGKKQFAAIAEVTTAVEEERSLIEAIDAEEWSTALKRRTQHYGFVYDYTAGSANKETKQFPEWCEFVVARLLERGVLLVRPDQLIINEYKPGQGIGGHVDAVNSFEDGVVSISLGSAINMNFVRSDEEKEIPLPRRSSIALFGVARYDWKHGIHSRKTDNGQKRERRVSLTFRKMKEK